MEFMNAPMVGNIFSYTGGGWFNLVPGEQANVQIFS